MKTFKEIRAQISEAVKIDQKKLKSIIDNSKSQSDAEKKVQKEFKVDSAEAKKIVTQALKGALDINYMSFDEGVIGEACKKKMTEEDDEELDKVNKKALKKDFKDREDKDIDNDGDVDDSDEYLHNRRKAISKAVKEDIEEGFNPKDITRKSIFFNPKGIMQLMVSDSEGFLKALNWKEFKASKAPFDASESSQKSFEHGVLNSIGQFNRKVDYNIWLRRDGKDANWEQRIDKMIELGASFTAKGLKV